MSKTDIRWRIRPSARLHTETFPSFLAIFNARSGDTHVLDAFPAEIFSLLTKDGRATLEDLAKHVGQLLDENPEAWQEAVSDVLEQLAEMEIVERLEP